MFNLNRFSLSLWHHEARQSLCGLSHLRPRPLCAASPRRTTPTRHRFRSSAPCASYRIRSLCREAEHGQCGCAGNTVRGEHVNQGRRRRRRQDVSEQLFFFKLFYNARSTAMVSYMLLVFGFVRLLLFFSVVSRVV